MSVESLPSYDKRACCNSDCYALGLYEDQPCWGKVSVVDEIEGADEWYWVHACEGHVEAWDCSREKYKPSDRSEDKT